MFGNCKSFLLAAVLFLFSVPAFSQSAAYSSSSDWLIGLKISTYGIGVEGRKIISDKFHIRTGFSHLSINYPLNNIRDDLDGKIRLSPSAIPLVVDYWPHKNIFVSTGAFLNFSKISIDGKVSKSVFIGDIEMYPDEIGHINADLVVGSRFSPYLGFGLSQNIKKYYLFLSFEGGVVFHGEPKVKLRATGMLTPTASDAQEALIEDNISPLTAYPFISFSLNYLLPTNKP